MKVLRTFLAMQSGKIISKYILTSFETVKFLLPLDSEDCMDQCLYQCLGKSTVRYM